MKRTKIICTLGSYLQQKNNTESPDKSRMDVARFNFSHGSHEEHGHRVDLIKKMCGKN